MSSNKMATKSDLQEMYSRILPYLGGSADAGFTPIGTIIAVFSETAPANYLICDGATYNKADYPELAAHLLALTTHSQYEVSGDSTKFKVPDLRGEFLRGTGTNSQATGDNGANVGVHQSPSEIPASLWIDNTTAAYPKVASNSNPDIPLNAVNITTKTDAIGMKVSTDGALSNQTLRYYAVRPTNTSVLFCIATKNIYLNPQNDYSTEEKVIGTWINGKTLYQRTIVDTMPEATTAGTWVQKNVALGISNLDMFINSYGLLDNPASDSNSYIQLPFINDSTGVFWFLYKYSAVMNSPYINLRNSNPPWSNKPCYITIQYTKTS